MRSVNADRQSNRFREVIAIAMAVFLALFVFASMAFLVKEANHECCGEGCPVCAELIRCGQTVHEIGGGILLAVFAVLAAIYVLQPVLYFISDIPAVTPVSRKIRMNN